MNCMIASRPTGIMRRGCKIRISSSIHDEQLRISSGRWDAVGPAGVFPGKTSADRREINSRSNGGFIHSAKFFEPAEKRFPSRVRKRPFQHRLPRTGRLSNNHYVTHYRAARNRRRLHTRASPAFQQVRDVTGQLNLFGLIHGRISHERTPGTPRRLSLWPL